ncbi:peptidoglycan-binding protein [Kitasatospora sp. NPDC005751]|uniref:peptidoglycan-binding domain-containing protein n=1 Tax=Kitasatospora sp. NPDC005751 TaxID=3157064 RepID=UPI00340C17B2
MSPSLASLTDAELGELLLSGSARRTATRELTRRYGDLVLAYAGTLCATPRAAHGLAEEVLDRALDAPHRDRLPGGSWSCLLLGEARLIAAGWAAAGRGDDLSPGFRAWLSVRRAPQQDPRDVVATVEGSSPLLAALGQLPDLPAMELWRALAADPATVPTPAPAARRRLADAYIRAHALGAPERQCRHLAALLGETAATDAPTPVELAAHLPLCDRCHRAMTDLRAVRRWEAGHLSEGLLARFRPVSADHRATTAPVGPGPDHVRVAPREEPPVEIVIGPAHRRTGPNRHLARRRLAIGAAGIGTVALALGLAMAEPPSSRVTGSPTPDGTSATVLDTIAPDPTDPSAAPVPPARESPSARPTAAATPSRSRTVPATPSSAPALAPPATVPGPTAGRPTTAGAPAPVSTPSTPAAAPTPPVAPAPTASPSAPTPPPARPLRRGDSGPEVTALQRLLIRAGCTPEPGFVQGRFDAVTERMLTGFQQAAGIRGDERSFSVFGDRTRAALEQPAAGPRCRPGPAAQG